MVGKVPAMGSGYGFLPITLSWNRFQHYRVTMKKLGIGKSDPVAVKQSNSLLLASNTIAIVGFWLVGINAVA